MGILCNLLLFTARKEGKGEEGLEYFLGLVEVLLFVIREYR